jgi:hypothetical protein
MKASISTFAHTLSGDLYTVSYMGWKSVKNGRLLAEAVANGFDAIVTMDQSMAAQLNFAKQPISVVVLNSRSNHRRDLVTLVPALLKALDKLVPGTFSHIRL